MFLGTFWELLALWFIICVVTSFLGGYKIIVVINVFIILSVIAGFFAGIGNQILLFILKGG